MEKSAAFTTADADSVFTAYNRSFYFTEGTNGFFHQTTAGGKTWFWERAGQLEMVLDVYDRTTNPACLTIFSNVFNGFLTDHGATWEKNEFNDDIMWMVIACARGYELTGNPAWRDAAKNNFDLCYARASSTNLGGGLWWKTSNRSKNACVNGPSAIAAYLLGRICGDTNYFTKSENIFQWERATLFNTNNGAVADAISADGVVHSWASTYNQGTFLGAANFLGHTNDAQLAADFMMTNLCRNGLLPAYPSNGDGGGFNGIGVRWLAKFMRQRGLESRYLPWLEKNAGAAWRARRQSDGLVWSRWPAPTPDAELYSWSCSSAVVLLQVIPPEDFRLKTADGQCAITINTARAPELKAWAETRLAPALAEWYPKISTWLASDGYAAPDHFTITLQPMDGVAYTTGRNVVANSRWLEEELNGEAVGALIHESVHVVQQFHGENPGWLVEGSADYFRWFKYEPQSHGADLVWFRQQGKFFSPNYDDSYRITANFLNWVSEKYDPDIFSQLNVAMRENRYDDALWKKYTGKTVSELGDEWKKEVMTQLAAE
jgi:predicted alpha-1,6-mannanase (GH76 family)